MTAPWHRPQPPRPDRDNAAYKASNRRSDAVAARIASDGATDLGPWLVRQGALTWDSTDQAIALGLVLRTLGRDARDDVREALCL